MSTRRVRSLSLVLIGAIGGILLSVGITAVAQRGEPLPLKELQQFANVFAAIKASYVEPVTDEKLINDAIKGMFDDLDPHSAYLDADAFKEMEAITQGGFGGLGIEIGSEDGQPKVISPIEDTPAFRAGILAGDLITHIDGKPTKGMTLSEAIKLMRGEPQTSIVLTISRAGRDKPLELTIVRDIIKVRSVRSKMLPNDIGYVRIAQFQERTAPDLVRHLRELGAEKPPKALILDLRNDPGGLLDSAIAVSSAFLPPNVLVVSTKGRIPSANREYHAKPADYLRNYMISSEEDYLADVVGWAKTVPMVVLVNVGSASASEIVAGALQDHKRATILGNRTFGKGSVQSVLPLGENTGIKLTTARYYTPSGQSIQVTGVTPDITVDDTPQGNLFRLPREADLQRHLVNGNFDETALSDDEDNTVDLARMFEFGGDDDYQLQQAINYLEGRPVQRNDPALVAKAKTEREAARAGRDIPASSSGAAGSVPVPPEKMGSGDEKKNSMRRIDPLNTERYRITPQGMERIEP
ncbi:S41 family peptidase [Yanghanlia caeni]|uniref:S41 family peptidase n=1 Tax=Yanghanlia caeni TaxID=3064283 RepID=A0ABU1D7N1_9BURK|nr:S41 family peptidase [Alcaligenaceae bacterium LG-2]NGR07626.1 S41 family peptidase [bacterium SGD-2]HZH56165.1 S41 family peptidase [Burkholderiaceae bacterium]